MNDKTRSILTYATPVVALAAILAGAYFAWSPLAPEEEGPPRLRVYCGGGLRPPVQEAIEVFQRRSGVQVEADYGASNLLLGRLKLSQQGDVFIPGDAFYVDEARREGLVAEERAVARFVPVIMVAKGNPCGIRSVADLAAPGVRLGLADERAAAIGRITPEIFRANGVPMEDVERNIVFTSVTGPELAQAVALGHVDACLVWKPNAMRHPDAADIVEIPEERNVFSPVSAAVLKTAAHPDDASEFVQFLAGPMGQEAFRTHRYDPAGQVSTP